MTQQLIRPSVYLQAYSITDLWDTNNTHAHVSFYFILRLNFLRGWTDVWSNRDLSYISFLSKQGGKRRREKTEQSRESPSDTMSAVLNSPSTAFSHILLARKHSVNRNPPFLTVLHDDPSPLFLVYSSHHVVSCLLMDSHWGCTCYSRLQRHRSDPSRLLTLYESVHTAVRGNIHCICTGSNVCHVWNKQRRRWWVCMGSTDGKKK